MENDNNNETKEQLPISCKLNTELQLFQILRCKGKTIGPGGFGVILNAGKKEFEFDYEDPVSRKMTLGEPNEYLFIEDVIFLYERGLLEAYDQGGQSLNSFELYNLLDKMGIPLAVYLVYAHLRLQTFRVVRHTTKRRTLLEEMETILIKKGENRRNMKCNDEEFKDLRRRLRHDTSTASPPLISTTRSPSLAFDVYSPNSKFSRTSPGLPDFYVSATYFNDAQLSFDALEALIQECRGIPLKMATVSDAGTVIMFGVTDSGVPHLKTKP